VQYRSFVSEVVGGALALLYYCFTTALLLLYYCFTHTEVVGGALPRVGVFIIIIIIG
jgi:hypothetical protein